MRPQRWSVNLSRSRLTHLWGYSWVSRVGCILPFRKPVQRPPSALDCLLTGVPSRFVANLQHLLSRLPNHAERGRSLTGGVLRQRPGGSTHPVHEVKERPRSMGLPVPLCHRRSLFRVPGTGAGDEADSGATTRQTPGLDR